MSRFTPGIRYAARAAAATVPQAYVSRDDAAASCEAAGKRLCRRASVYAACQGSRRTRYPTVPRSSRGRCNVGKPHLMSKVFGEGVTFTFEAHYNSPRLNQEPGFLARTGSTRAASTTTGSTTWSVTSTSGSPIA
jgi:hypothetical protein